MNNSNPLYKENKIIYFLFLSFFILFFSCEKEPNIIEIEYETDLEEFINPERGFYRPFGTKASNFQPLNAEVLRNLRAPNLAAGGFQVASSLIYRSYQFDTFLSKPLSEELLLNIQTDMDIVREVGDKIVLRFTYSDTCCESPFNDAPKSTILTHLKQLKPILYKNNDVIAVVQMGLIGPWGEQFYSDHFGDLEHGPVTKQNWIDRKEVIEALLEAVPKSRMVQVRAPYYKLNFLVGEAADPAHAKALELKDAFNGTAIARLAHHNDCIMANYDDYWTYHSFKDWPAKSDTLHLKPYIAKETKFLVFGGETCPGGPNGEDVYNPFNNCLSDGGNAENYLKRFHTSFLNTAWSGAVNGDWNNKCIDDIKRSLGYRFEIRKGIYPAVIRNEQKTKIKLDIMNTGYASTYNYRLVELILRNKQDQKTYKVAVDSDTRFWFSDELQTLDLELEWPVVLPKGDYELFMNLPDAEKSIYDRPEYAIRLASKYKSKSIWDKSTGWNLLLPSVKVK